MTNDKSQMTLRILLGFSLSLLFVLQALAQIENVPVTNQVYDFLDRMAVMGVLPAYNNAMIPISRKEVAELLMNIDVDRDKLNEIESEYLSKFKTEFKHELNLSTSEDAVFFRDGFSNDIFSHKEKYLYEYADSSVSVYVEFIGSLDHRRVSGDSYGSTSTTLEQHGGRIRGTLKEKLGFYLQGTDGTVFGDKEFALTDPILQGNNKLREPTSKNFDFTDAYLRAELNWFNLEFGKERTLIGNGYSDQLILSRNAPAFDFLKIDAQYKSVKYLFLHGTLVRDFAVFPGTLPGEPAPSNKYIALHRLQISLWDRLNIGLSEMTIYQRTSPEFAYLNPINFYKSAEHALGDRDNSFLNLDLEFYPINNFKCYGTLLIDDIDFSKLGTGWWGNELGLQGGVVATQILGCPTVDAVAEYTHIEPYVYSNRTDGVAYTNNNLGLGHSIGPNSDEWFLQLRWRPAKILRSWISYAGIRHGDNIEVNGEVINVGGSVLQGHRQTDSETAKFLDGNLIRTDKIQLRAAVEPINNFIIYGAYEFRSTKYYATQTRNADHFASLSLQVEY